MTFEEIISAECFHIHQTYSGTYDSMFCIDCGEWLEKPCKCDPKSGCPYVNRPSDATNDFEYRIRHQEEE